MLNRIQSPPIKDAVDFKLVLPPYEKLVLKNNIPVYTINAGAEDVMVLEFVFFAGNFFEEKNLVAAATNALLKNGTTQKNAFGINEYFEYFGSYLNRACQNETSTLTLHCLSRHLTHLLPVIREIITECTFPDRELEIFKQNSRQQLSVNLKKSDYVASRLIDKFLYGEDHPYGKFSSHEAYGALQPGQLREFYNNYYVHGKYILFAAGKLPTDFELQLNNFFGDLKVHPELRFPKKDISPASEKKFRINNDPSGVQGAVRIARHFPNRHHPDFKKVMVLNTLFGGFFGSRLMGNIREEKGYTYSIYSYLQNHINESAWLVSTEAGKDVCEETISEVYKEMKLLREEPVEAEELLLVKNYMIGSNLGDLDGPFHIINRWKNLILNDLDEKYFYEYIDTIKNITAEELQQLAGKYLLPEEFYELVVV